MFTMTSVAGAIRMTGAVGTGVTNASIWRHCKAKYTHYQNMSVQYTFSEPANLNENQLRKDMFLFLTQSVECGNFELLTSARRPPLLHILASIKERQAAKYYKNGQEKSKSAQRSGKGAVRKQFPPQKPEVGKNLIETLVL